MRVTGPSDWSRTPTHHGDMERAVAISAGLTGSSQLYAAVVTTAPGASTRRHHHGACETAIYVLEGHARFTWGPTGVEQSLDAGRGDFVYIPAGEAHVEANASDDEDLVVIVSRNCPDALTVYLDDEEEKG